MRKQSEYAKQHSGDWEERQSQIRLTNGQVVTLITYLQVTAQDRRNDQKGIHGIDEILDFLISGMEETV